MAEVFGILMIVFAVAAVMFFLRFNSVEAARVQLAGRISDLEKKAAAAQEEARAAREDMKKKAAALEEARERANKAARKEARKEKQKDAQDSADVAPAVDPEKMAAYAAAVEAANRRAADAEKRAQASIDAMKAEGRKDAENEIADLKKKISAMEKARKDEERAREDAARKADEEARAAPHVPGARVDLAALDKTVVEELRRFYKRAANAEKLLAVADTKLELATDKLEEAQRRYYAVCRELALVAVNKDKPAEIADAEAEKLAMDMVRASEVADRIRAESRGNRGPRPPRRQENEGGGQRPQGDRPPRSDRPRRDRRAADGAPAPQADANTARHADKPEGDAAKPADAPAAPAANA